MAEIQSLRAVLGAPELQRVMTRVRERVERAGLEPRGTVSIRGATEAERSAIARLVGAVPSSGVVMRLSLDRLDEALRGSRFRVGLVEALEALGEPLTDRRAARVLAQMRRDALWEDARSHPAATRHPGLEGWLERVRATGLLARLDAGDGDLLCGALDVLDRLPARGEGRAVLAAAVTGDAHSLDDGRSLSRLVLGALAHLQGRDLPSSARARRSLWAAFGVVCDGLSCDVLVLGLRPRGRGSVAIGLRPFCDAGEPFRLTLRQLQRSELDFKADRVFVCENPAVVEAAADVHGSSCAPIVCVDGIPNSAALALLGRLGATGTRILFHCDFDWGGIKVGNSLAATVGALPWRFGTRDYEQASGSAGVVLGGRPVSAAWDRELRPAMEAVGRAVHEEQVVETLLGDLSP